MWGQGRTSNSDYGKFAFSNTQTNRAAARSYSPNISGYGYQSGGLAVQRAPGYNYYGGNSSAYQGNRWAPGAQMMNQGMGGFNWNQGQSGDQLLMKVEVGEEAAAAAALGMPLQQFQAQNGYSVNYGAPMTPMKEVKVMQQQEPQSTPGSQGDQIDEQEANTPLNETKSNANTGMAEQMQTNQQMQQQSEMLQQALQQQSMQQHGMQQGMSQPTMQQQSARNQVMAAGGRMNQFNNQYQRGMNGGQQPRMPMMHRNPAGVAGPPGSSLLLPVKNTAGFKLCGKCSKCKDFKGNGVGIQNQQHQMTFPTRPVLATGVRPRMS